MKKPVFLLIMMSLRALLKNNLHAEALEIIEEVIRHVKNEN